MAPERAVADVLQDILNSLRDMVRAEVRLAKVELKSDAFELVRSGAWMGAGVLGAGFGVHFALWSATYGLGNLMPMWAATLVVALVLAVLSTTLVIGGLRKARAIRPLPERTIETVKESIEWMKPSGK
jgi:uncharacterized membrane protein YqjE